MTRAEVTEKILTAKRLQELSWGEIAIGGPSKIVVTAACMGQMKMTREQAGHRLRHDHGAPARPGRATG